METEQEQKEKKKQDEGDKDRRQEGHGAVGLGCVVAYAVWRGANLFKIGKMRLKRRAQAGD